MKITPNEAMKLGLWESICDIQGIDVWAIKEGQLDPDTELEINVDELKDGEE